MVFCDTVPPAPVHVIVYDVDILGYTNTEPDDAYSLDCGDPAPQHDVASFDDHDSVDD